MSSPSRAQAERPGRWAPAGAAVGVVAAVGLVALVAALLGGTGSQEASGPPPLRLGSAAGAAESASASGDASSFFVTDSALGSGYRLEGTLPSDGPERGAVHRPAAGSAAEVAVRRLAAALGLDAEPRRDGERWTVQSGTSTLDVSAEPGQPWWYGEVLDLPLPVEPVPGTEPAGAVGEDAALAAARPELTALGLTGADVHTETHGDGRTVVAAPRVDGLPTQGVETQLEVGPEGGLRWASGLLGELTRGDEYPLVGASEVFALLQTQPHSDIAALCAPDVPCRSATGCWSTA